MASPQKENGNTQIANELLEAFCRFRVPGEVMQVILTIIRKTYGYHKKTDWIAHSQIQEATGMTKQAEGRALATALEHKLVIKNDDQLGVNKNYEEWVSFRRVIKNDDARKVIKNETRVIKKETAVIKNDYESSSKMRDTKEIKETVTKETITKDKAITSPDKRNTELQELIDFAKERQFSLQGSQQDQRRYAYNLLRKPEIGLLKAKWLVEAACQCRGKPFAPVVNDFKSLFYKWSDLLSYIQKNKSKGAVYESEFNG